MAAKKLKDSTKHVLLYRQFYLVDFSEDFLEDIGGDVSVALLVVDPEGLFEFVTEPLLVLLNHVLGSDLAESLEVNLLTVTLKLTDGLLNGIFLQSKKGT